MDQVNKVIAEMVKAENELLDTALSIIFSFFSLKDEPIKHLEVRNYQDALKKEIVLDGNVVFSLDWERQNGALELVVCKFGILENYDFNSY